MKRAFIVGLAALFAAGCASTSSAPLPSAGVETTPVVAEFPTTPPQPGPAPTLSLPSPERRSLENGLEVVYVREADLPLIQATLMVPAGSTAEPAEIPGLASFVADMLDEGAGGRDALELAAALDLIGARLSTSAGIDAAYVSLAVLSDRLAEALPLLADVTFRPDFPQSDLERLREQRITALTAARDEPSAIAGNAFTRLVFGEEHPYGRLATTATTREIDRDALAEFHQAHYRPHGSTLILVGDVDPDVIHPQLARAFAEWTGRAPQPVKVNDAPGQDETRIYLIDKPGAAQSEIRIGHVGVARDHPDHFPLTVLNTILGGSFTSRLNMNLRETHGYSYGARSSFAMRRGAGPFMASSAVFTAVTDSAVVQFFEELRRIREEPVTQDDLERAKNYVALGMPRLFETVGGVASQIADLELYGLSMDYFNDYVPRLMAVTAEDVQRVAREYVRPDQAVVVVVGDVEQIEAGLRALPIGSVEIRQTEEFVQ